MPKNSKWARPKGQVLFKRLFVQWVKPLTPKGYFCCCCSVSKACLTLCDSMDCSTSGLLVPHHLPDFKFMSIESVMPSNHLILCCPVLLLPSIFPSIRVFSSDMQRICPCPNNQNLWTWPYLEKNPGRFHSVNVSNWDRPGLSKQALNPMTHALINNRKAEGDLTYR